MGTHTTLPSKVPAESNKTLAEVLKADPSLTGDKVIKAFPDSKEGALPFLFKVLSIGTALSIQAHPDKTLAERLHRERGDVYKGESRWGYGLFRALMVGSRGPLGAGSSDEAQRVYRGEVDWRA